jgi:hypothetical protein
MVSGSVGWAGWCSVKRNQVTTHHRPVTEEAAECHGQNENRSHEPAASGWIRLDLRKPRGGDSITSPTPLAMMRQEIGLRDS